MQSPTSSQPAENESTSKPRKSFYNYRGALVSPPLLFAMFSTWREWENEPAVWILAGVIFMLGVGIRIWSQQHLRFRLRMGMNLTNTGPYALLRNPIYVGNTLICLSMITVSELMWLLPVQLALCIFTYAMVVRYEESHLTGLYGEPYREYLEQVPRWIPRVPSGYKPGFITPHLLASIRTEAYNVLLLVPYILKELLWGR